MAINSFDAVKDELLKDNKRLRDIIPHALESLMIGGKGGSPGQPYDDPDKGKGPFVPAPPRDKLAGLRINPNTIMLPKEPAPAESDDDYGEGAPEGHPDWKMAHGEGRGPQPKYHDEYNQPLDIPPWMQMFPDGKVREIPWMKEEYLKEHPELFANASSRQIRDRLKPFTKGKGYDDAGGSLRGLPNSLRIQLLRDAKA